MPDQVLLDILHIGHKGTLQSLLSLWTHSSNSDYQYYLNKPALRLLNQKLLLIKYPSEIKRAQRELTYLSYFKANEFRNLIYYTLIYVLKDIMIEDIYEHFVLYVIFIRILTKNKLNDSDFELSQLLIEEFVKNFDSIYGSKNMQPNLHAHLHLSEQCSIKFGPLDKMSGHPFEGNNL